MVAAKAAVNNFHLTLSVIVLVYSEHAMMLYSTMFVKWAWAGLTRGDKQTMTV
ncbi:hypothetical protein [Acetobacter sp. UBA5411]|uniref:hypothetical protein n=1 Tax=Acetobacter sp. UBA5411 TaxID=1945905 RepID=UPI0025C51107|nr:hypothetical protein [Acetobacter sp. UBA5411]